MKATVKFNTQKHPEFFKELRNRVQYYFDSNNKTRFADNNMRFKTAFMLSLYFVPLIILLSGITYNVWFMLGMWVLMGFGMSGIGLSIMHDANHGAYSKNKRTNKWLGFLINFLGGYHKNWRIQHNVLHHSFTNIEGFDEDIKNPLMRFSPDQKHKKIHRYQLYYGPFLYAIMTLYWFVSKDYEQLVRYKKKGLLKTQGMKFNKALTEVIVYKFLYLVLTLIIPLVLIPLPWWQILIGFFIMHFICGMALALIFQPAHVVQETDFFYPDETGSVENNWAIHQMKTTSNFAHGSRLFSWFIGGLNYQIEHHLFPQICHTHYRKISRIVRETATEYGITYHRHKTFLQALISHFKTLHQLGKNTYPVSA
jgi:linoleoyl-CoA desaturase